MTGARLDRIPLFVPAGSILPFGPKEQYVSEKRSDPVELRIYPGADARFILYEDEGTNYNYEHGAFSLVQLQWNERNHELVIGKRTGSYPGMTQEREFSVQLVGSSVKAKVVAYQGRELHVSLN
jgi:alpha-D-xyloside xylohydrolase